jgi:hypothetical protein
VKLNCGGAAFAAFVRSGLAGAVWLVPPRA